MLTHWRLWLDVAVRLSALLLVAWMWAWGCPLPMTLPSASRVSSPRAEALGPLSDPARQGL